MLRIAAVAVGRRCRPMARLMFSPPPWLHLLLTFVLTPVGLFGGALVVYGLFLAVVIATGLGQPGGGAKAVVLGLLAVVSFVGGAALGLRFVVGTFTRHIAARCPACGGEAYYQDGRPITYLCVVCGHVHASIWSSGGPYGRGRPPSAGRKTGSSAGGTHTP